ncbi:3-oxoacyl-[acyl-carrier protein] reductase [Pediococcus acidilactici NGRI 0510Q]|uniref:3-oxoacyl-ACP reductase FabG n=1 Tax=Pediococcus acidilactici TaxID=1254 RepID=A0AAW8YF33_PEDAC|nr:3-oxoacyl-ACP reductase FabG [Pediococcus acidilactici]GAC46235.1 3-oxoacyl-[acyl-carrier protein] reductase [Pediococcus acidilactici NGRI 0510Q]APR28354.1 beta-ketoacyl-ACP reductase [Pediococcus acidilactici]KRN91908.1 3-oxoacyl-[acyl-carrier protein] reductase [Pediococcus acidilactici]MDV2620263.1 3-oxoacyl-ACP reductase FabG [Pediococcus acidilactici]QIO85268.1 SDR family oxidoreductase [Pediococcus acidilactici]
MDIKDKVAVVTGGTKGIGLAIAKDLAQQGAKVFITARRAVEDEVLQNELNDLGITFKNLDIRADGEVGTLLNELNEEQGHVDIVINNAGITRDKLLSRMSVEDFEEVIATNLVGTFSVTKYAMKIMQKQRSGNIVNISSISGTHGNVGQANYSASKAGIVGLTKTTAREGLLRNIRCNAIAPGMIETAMTGKLSDKVRAKTEEMIPMHRFGQPEEIAMAVSFLLKNDYITGQVLTVDGGLTL